MPKKHDLELTDANKENKMDLSHTILVILS